MLIYVDLFWLGTLEHLLYVVILLDHEIHSTNISHVHAINLGDDQDYIVLE